MAAQHSYEQFADTNVDPVVRGFLHQAASANGDGLVLAHGAGSNAQAPLLVAVAEDLTGRGYVVLRCNLPYRQERTQGPPRPGDAARDRDGLKNAAAVMRKLAPRRVFLGGHSYGARQATMICAEEPGLVEGLLLLSYPLHPPRKPEQRRVQHLPKLETPALFVSGTRDPFGTIDELADALRLIPGRTKLMVVEGAGHDLKVKKALEGAEIGQRIGDGFEEFFGSRPDGVVLPSN